MRKFILTAVLLIAVSALVSGTLTGCSSKEDQTDTVDTVVVKAPLASPQQGEGDEVITVEGVAIEGSSNTVTIQTQDGKEMTFDYNKDNYDSKDLYNWDLDENNKIKVSYVEGEKGDSVIRIQKGD